MTGNLKQLNLFSPGDPSPFQWVLHSGRIYERIFGSLRFREREHAMRAAWEDGSLWGLHHVSQPCKHCEEIDK